MEMNLKTERLSITEFMMHMAMDVHLNSLDEDTRRFVPDEYFEDLSDALDTVSFLMTRYDDLATPLVYPVLLKDGTNIGYVQLADIDDGYEVGYHIAKQHTGKGYATEAVRAFLPKIMRTKHIGEVYGICHAENVASIRVLEKCGFTKVFEGVAPYQGVDAPIVKYVFKK